MTRKFVFIKCCLKTFSTIHSREKKNQHIWTTKMLMNTYSGYRFHEPFLNAIASLLYSQKSKWNLFSHLKSSKPEDYHFILSRTISHRNVVIYINQLFWLRHNTLRARLTASSQSISQHRQYRGRAPLVVGGGVVGAKYAWTVIFGKWFWNSVFVYEIIGCVDEQTEIVLTRNLLIAALVIIWQSYNSMRYKLWQDTKYSNVWSVIKGQLSNSRTDKLSAAQLPAANCLMPSSVMSSQWDNVWNDIKRTEYSGKYTKTPSWILNYHFILPISPNWDIPLPDAPELSLLSDYILPNPSVPSICSSANNNAIRITRIYPHSVLLVLRLEIPNRWTDDSPQPLTWSNIDCAAPTKLMFGRLALHILKRTIFSTEDMFRLFFGWNYRWCSGSKKYINSFWFKDIRVFSI